MLMDIFFSHTIMSREDIESLTKQLLKEFYQLNNEDIPNKRERSRWLKENKFGFFLGIIQSGQDFLVSELYNLLQTGDFKVNEKEVIDKMYSFHIEEFKQHNGSGSSCHTPSAATSPSVSRSNSVEDLDDDYIPEESEKKLEHVDLKKAVRKRDGVCLFCWDKTQCEAAHIFGQKGVNLAYDEPSLFQRSGLKQKHQVQNGLLLCVKCHREFDALKRYVDVVEDKFVVKVVNYSSNNDTASEEHKDWQTAVRIVRAVRAVNEENWTQIDGRKAVEANGEMALYFVQSNPSLMPDRKALEFHKTACLIWRMAGGAEPEEESCPDYDDDYPTVDYRRKEILKWMEDSNTTLNTRT
jgi:hypothetical protein